MNQPLEKVIGGKYEILAKIKEGGMGAIYKVRHRLLDEVRVIKVLRPQLATDVDLQARFQNEAKTAIKLRHPNIAHLYDFSMDKAGNAYIVMEFIDGVNFKELVEKSGPPEFGLALELGRQALDAIGYLHQKGFVHRDIAADNLMLTQDFQGEPLVKLIDLGIAKGENRSGQLTATGIFLGKARYAPPEQFTPEGAASLLDERGDLYSFGVLLYELLTGQSPIEGESFSEMVAGHLFRPPLAFDVSDPKGTVPQGVREAVLKALEKKPEDRFASAEELAERLAAFEEPAEGREKAFTKAMKTTIALIAKEPTETKPGSTQGRIDMQFGLDETSAVAPEETLRPTEISPDQVPAQAAGSDRSALGRGPLWLGAGAVGLLVVAALFFFLRGGFLGGSATSTGAPEAAAMEVATPERFDPAEYEPSSLDRAVPPPFEDESGRPAGQPSGRAAAPPPTRQGSLPVRPTESEARPQVQPQAAAPQGPAPRPGEIFRPGPDVRPPVLESMPPATPPAGAEVKDEIVLIVSALVNEEGRVLTARVSSGPAFKRKLKDAAVELVKQAEFSPAVRSGHPGRMWTDVKVIYRPE